ncbi:hypothetical protein ITJ42_16170 [Clavibacter michiganensis subsp. phaseoli]|uniref:Uncharacterized protein n=1 Tax=Clavibacter phaseoli TaxID=1734031 RepID=A0A8I0SDF4_9MICO|nr:hypothetical protein [Clavibacter phaseoli]MBF4632756.1 hypothetical protein [Clavibacter phaseoli]
MTALVTVGLMSWLHGTATTDINVLTLSADNLVPIAVDASFDTTALVSESFYGVTVITAPNQADPAEFDAGCMTVVPTERGSDMSTTYACGAGPISATVAMTVTSGMPDDLRQKFPDGSTLQFVLDGDTVHVRKADQ